MKKILIFNSGAFIYGAERGLINLLRALDGKFNITVVLPSKGPLAGYLRQVYPSVRIIVFPLAVLVNSRSPLYLAKYCAFFLANIIYFALRVILSGTGLIMTNNLLLITPGIVARVCRRQHVWYVREFTGNDDIDRMLGAYVSRLSDAVICQSNAIMDKLGLTGRAEVVYEPLNDADYYALEPAEAKKILNIPADARVVSVVSRIHPSKGQFEFIRDIKDVLKSREDLYLILAGDITLNNVRDRQYKSDIARLIKNEGLSRVRLLSFMDDVSPVFSASDICVFPFRREEPFGIAVAEALAFGKETYYPRSGGLREVYGIFGEGHNYNIEAVEHALLRGGGSNEGKTALRVPDKLSYSRYKDAVWRILKKYFL
ncbi:MAG: glycosyltransferase [Candidatus Omnitrophota bacterium]